MNVIPERLCDLAEGFRTAAEHTRDSWNTASSGLGVDGRAAGNTQGGIDLVAAHTACADAAEVAVGKLAAVFEQDMDDMYACAFDFSSTDEKQAESYKSHLPLLAGIFPYDPTVDWSKYER